MTDRHVRVTVLDERVRMRDGTELAADVFLPDDGAPHPVLLTRTPYQRAGARRDLDPAQLARNGWAVVCQDVRGRFDSGGVFDPFHQETADGQDTVAWCAAQPWSDGRVALTGSSYLGATALLAATARVPALGAVAASVTADDYGEGWTHEGGILRRGFAAPWAARFAGTTQATRAAAAPLTGRFPDLLYDRGYDAALAEVFPPYGRWLDAGDESYWGPIRLRDRYERVGVPVMHVAGWYDIFCEGTLRNYTGLRARAATERARRGQRLIVGPWAHEPTLARAVGELDFGPAASGAAQDVPGEQDRFLRAALDGEQVPAGARVFVMGADHWRDYPSWPVPAEDLALHLDADGAAALTAHPPRSAGTARFHHDPDDPVPTAGGRGVDLVLPAAGPFDQRRVEERDDVTVFTGEPLRQDLTVIGEVSAELALSAAPGPVDVMLKLCDVHPDGRSFNVVGAGCRVMAAAEPRSFRILLGSTAMTFRAGHRIRLQIAGSDFPRLALDPRPGTRAVHTGGPLPSLLHFPVVR